MFLDVIVVQEDLLLNLMDIYTVLIVEQKQVKENKMKILNWLFGTNNSKIYTFKDLQFKDDTMPSADMKEFLKTVIDIQKEYARETYENYLDHKRAFLEFDNGFYISVLLGKMYYSNGVDNYEVYSNLEGECLGYMSSEEVTEYMIKIQNARR